MCCSCCRCYFVCPIYIYTYASLACAAVVVVVVVVAFFVIAFFVIAVVVELINY